MGHWGEGYPVETAYLSTFQPELAPRVLDAALFLRGRAGPRPDRPFRYCELGCGAAHGLAALAAANPHAEFAGYDFMPEAVAEAEALIGDAELANLVVEERSFADLAVAPPAERFDFVTLHGVFAWVSDENRRALVALLDRIVRPGGVVFVSYDAMPAWALLEPIRRIMREALDAHPGGPVAGRVGPARKAVEDWLGLVDWPEVGALWEKIARQPDRFLLHQFGSRHARAFWSREVADAMAGAKLEHVASARLVENLDPVMLSEAGLGFVRDHHVTLGAETARDLAAQRSFRHDVFVRGAPRRTLAQTEAAFAGMRFLRTGARTASEAERLGAGLRPLDPALTDAVLAAAGDGVATGAELAERAGLDPRRAIQAALFLIATDALRIAAASEPAGAAQACAARFNAAAARRRALDDPLPALSSPLLGGGVRLTAAEQDEVGGATPLGRELARLGIGVD